VKEQQNMSVATSAIERLQDVAGRTGAVTGADERATAAELHVPLAAVHGAATFYDDLANTRRGSRHVRVCEGTACFVTDGGQHLADVERALGVSVGACRRGQVGIAAGGALHWLLCSNKGDAVRRIISDSNASSVVVAGDDLR
jgi:NADH:ubiquinone oxidoreductase subunit E